MLPHTHDCSQMLVNPPLSSSSSLNPTLLPATPITNTTIRWKSLSELRRNSSIRLENRIEIQQLRWKADPGQLQMATGHHELRTVQAGEGVLC